MPQAPNGEEKKRSESLLKHPLVILLVGTSLSYIFIPWISEKSSHKRLLQEQRINLATEILKQGLQDDQQLSSIHTAFAIFDKQQSAFPGDPSSGKQIRDNFSRLYGEFDQHAWWWYHDLTVKSRLLGLPVEGQKEIEKLQDLYRQNLVNSAQQVERLRVQFCAKSYNPDDPRNAQVLGETKKALDELVIERGAIVSRMSNVFMPSQW